MTLPMVNVLATARVDRFERRGEDETSPLIISKKQKAGRGHGCDGQGEMLAR